MRAKGRQKNIASVERKTRGRRDVEEWRIRLPRPAERVSLVYLPFLLQYTLCFFSLSLSLSLSVSHRIVRQRQSSRGTLGNRLLRCYDPSSSHATCFTKLPGKRGVSRSLNLRTHLQLNRSDINWIKKRARISNYPRWNFTVTLPVSSSSSSRVVTLFFLSSFLIGDEITSNWVFSVNLHWFSSAIPVKSEASCTWYFCHTSILTLVSWVSSHFVSTCTTD